MRIKKKILLYSAIALIVPIIGLYIFLAVSNNPLQFWRNVSKAQISIDGQQIDAGVYRRPSGKMLIDVGKDRGPYLYFPEAQNVGLCNSIRSVSIPGYIYAYDFDDKNCPCVLMGTAKTEVDAKVVIQQNSLEFTSIDGKRVQVSW